MVKVDAMVDNIKISSPSAHPASPHKLHRIGWLRASVLGANDGIISTASLLIGVISSGASHDAIVIAGTAGLTAGAVSMAAGEFVSVSSQADLERSDIDKEREYIKNDPQAERIELAEIYRARGLSEATAQQVAAELMETDALAAHVRDELGLSESTTAQPLIAALSSALTFALAGAIPFLAAVLSPHEFHSHALIIATMLALVLLGLMSASAAGSRAIHSILRIVLWGLFALGFSSLIGALVGVQMGG